MATHDLKCWPVYFAAVLDGTKPFEVRKDDRGYAVGDRLRLREWDPFLDGGEEYTGREALRRVTYILRGAEHLAPGYCVLGIVALSEAAEQAESAAPAQPAPARSIPPTKLCNHCGEYVERTAFAAHLKDHADPAQPAPVGLCDAHWTADGRFVAPAHARTPQCSKWSAQPAPEVLGVCATRSTPHEWEEDLAMSHACDGWHPLGGIR